MDKKVSERLIGARTKAKNVDGRKKKKKLRVKQKSLCRVGYLKIVYSWTTSFQTRKKKNKKRSKKLNKANL